jgi:hypothetical protein
MDDFQTSMSSKSSVIPQFRVKGSPHGDITTINHILHCNVWIEHEVVIYCPWSTFFAIYVKGCTSCLVCLNPINEHANATIKGFRDTTLPRLEGPSRESNRLHLRSSNRNVLRERRTVCSHLNLCWIPCSKPVSKVSRERTQNERNVKCSLFSRSKCRLRCTHRRSLI